MIPLTKVQKRGHSMFLCCHSKQTGKQTLDWPVIRDDVTVIWHRLNDVLVSYMGESVTLAQLHDANDATLKGISKIDQSHRCGHRQAACREPAGSYDKTTRTAICFEHKTQYLLIRAPYTRIVVFWHISKIPPWLGRVKLVVIPPRFV